MRIIRKIIPLVLALASPGLLLGVIVSTWSKIPFEDQWDVPGYPLWAHAKGQPLLKFLFAQHNESRKALTSLVWFGLSRGGWDCRIEMLAAYLLFAVSFVLYLRLVPRSGFPGQSCMATQSGDSLGRAAHACGIFLPAVASAVVFTPFAMSMWVWGVNVENALLILLLFCGVTLIPRLGERPAAWAGAAVLSTLATFTYLNGFVFWVVFCPLWSRFGAGADIPPQRRTRAGLPGYLAAFACVVLFYLHGYAQPPGHPSVLAALAHPVLAVLFFLAMFGAPFSVAGALSGVSAVALGFASLAVCVCLVWLLLRRANPATAFRTLLPWFMLCAYSLMSVFMISVGRVGRGFYTALAERYYNHTMPFHLAVLAMLLLAGKHTRGSKALRAAVTAGLVVYFAVVPASLALRWASALDVAKLTSQERTLGEFALGYSRLAPNNEALRLLYGQADLPASRGSDLIQYHVLDLPLHTEHPSAYEFKPVEGTIHFTDAGCDPFCQVVLTVVLPDGLKAERDTALVISTTDQPGGPGIRYLLPLGDNRFVKGRAGGKATYAFPVPVPQAGDGAGPKHLFVLTPRKN